MIRVWLRDFQDDAVIWLESSNQQPDEVEHRLAKDVLAGIAFGVNLSDGDCEARGRLQATTEAVTDALASLAAYCDHAIYGFLRRNRADLHRKETQARETQGWLEREA